jgi:hypothetical protein
LYGGQIKELNFSIDKMIDQKELIAAKFDIEREKFNVERAEFKNNILNKDLEIIKFKNN